MGLPIVVEIALGLIFIYLTLSLVASEIQEILSALFQWRAEHLKRSIEQLLAGDGLASRQADRLTEGTVVRSSKASLATERLQNKRAAKTLSDRLYDAPLIEDLNYEAQGRVSGFFRGLLHVIGGVYRTITFSRNVFGTKTSGPSYIPAETFATSLLDRLKLADFQRLLMRSRFGDFVRSDVRIPLHNMVNELRARLNDEDLLAAEMVYFDQCLNQVLDDLDSRRLTLEAAVAQVTSQLESFEAMAAESPALTLTVESAIAQSFLNRLRYLRSGLSGSPQHRSTQISGQSSGQISGDPPTVLLARIRPSLSDLTALLDPNSATYAELVALSQREGGAVLSALERLQSEVIPARLRESLATLSSRAEARVLAAGQATGSEIQQLQTEVETWFNNGMERASGVYRRNVKGVGLLIGLAIAFTLNADTFFMFQRLSTDPAIRSSIIQTADRFDVQGLNSAEDLAADMSVDDLSERMQGDLRSVGLAVQETLAAYPLPIGRTQPVLEAQQAAEASWPVPFIPQRLVGWSITALALSMGASFWFDLLRKVMSVRASGEKPES
ncbi:MAG: hypothetical protein AAFO06_14910 [Cyanobacteria bacterium J06597_16]